LVAYFTAKDRIRRLSSPKRFSVKVEGYAGVKLAPLPGESGEFRRWKDALQYARGKAAETGQQATIVDTGRLEWCKYEPMNSPLYFVEPSGAWKRYRN